jgi:ribonuclease PH
MVIGKLLYDIILGIPMTLAKKTLEGIRDAADKERLITEDSIKQKLQELQLLLQDGDISEEEYEELETKLIERLKAVREYQRG